MAGAGIRLPGNGTTTGSGSVVLSTSPTLTTPVLGAASATSLTLTGGRLQHKAGADVASANDMVLGSDGNVFSITGTTQINTISASGWQKGSHVVLLFDTSVTVKHNTAGTGALLLLPGAADFSATANDIMEFVFDGTSWRCLARFAI